LATTNDAYYGSWTYGVNFFTFYLNKLEGVRLLAAMKRSRGLTAGVSEV
jgi:hypothetical protein